MQWCRRFLFPDRRASGGKEEGGHMAVCILIGDEVAWRPPLWAFVTTLQRLAVQMKKSPTLVGLLPDKALTYEIDLCHLEQNSFRHFMEATEAAYVTIVDDGPGALAYPHLHDELVTHAGNLISTLRSDKRA